MKKISILVTENTVIQSIADPQYCFETVNYFLNVKGKPSMFDVQLVGVSNGVRLNKGRYSIHPDKLIDEVDKTDLIIIPALFGNMDEALESNKNFISWIVKQYKSGAEVASLCVGAFLLASTGLLKGKKCSTHWGFIDDFSKMFPHVNVQPGSIITEESGIYTSGGANSYWNLLLHLVEKYTNRETALLISKYFAIEIGRSSQSFFAMFKGQKQHNDEDIKKAQEFIERNIEEKITVEELAEKLAVGRRSLERRFKKATNNSVHEYIQRVKIEAAKRNIETSRKNINEVMFEVGYTDTKAFRTTFKKITGITPVEYRNRYNKIETESIQVE
ncbi:helix-turn-helix domain-containing protein [Maribellus comscasis]|uniref:Helix-turn-helix domain-containing protein n=1 Tax=Maribellus comscasis TaxID=2681766 RepID=A0A6I6JPT3_9BACT|nr:helix-turn-helix domain-containing protein [Maribellus comscasis]QGY42242.1 helix-turn-helix domain-containing protein [Maribellus comscasis]